MRELRLPSACVRARVNLASEAAAHDALDGRVPEKHAGASQGTACDPVAYRPEGTRLNNLQPDCEKDDQKQ